MSETGQKEVSPTDPDSRLMRVDSRRLDVCYNVESSVDSKNHLMIDYDTTNISDDHNELARMAQTAKETLGVGKLGHHIKKKGDLRKSEGKSSRPAPPAARSRLA